MKEYLCFSGLSRTGAVTEEVLFMVLENTAWSIQCLGEIVVRWLV
jgi:hypothetical protein